MSDTQLTPQQLAEACADAMFSRDHASKGLGMRITRVAPGFAELTMTVRQDMVQGHGNCHYPARQQHFVTVDYLHCREP